MVSLFCQTDLKRSLTLSDPLKFEKPSQASENTKTQDFLHGRNFNSSRSYSPPPHPRSTKKSHESSQQFHRRQWCPPATSQHPHTKVATQFYAKHTAAVSQRRKQFSSPCKTLNCQIRFWVAVRGVWVRLELLSNPGRAQASLPWAFLNVCGCFWPLLRLSMIFPSEVRNQLPAMHLNRRLFKPQAPQRTI